MDTETGQIHLMTPEETGLWVEDKKAALKAMSARIGVEEEKLIPLDRLPSINCNRCNGTGRVRAGMQSKRLKPCKCTLLEYAKQAKEAQDKETCLTVSF